LGHSIPPGCSQGVCVRAPLVGSLSGSPCRSLAFFSSVPWASLASWYPLPGDVGRDLKEAAKVGLWEHRGVGQGSSSVPEGPPPGPAMKCIPYKALDGGMFSKVQAGQQSHPGTAQCQGTGDPTLQTWPPDGAERPTPSTRGWLPPGGTDRAVGPSLKQTPHLLHLYGIAVVFRYDCGWRHGVGKCDRNFCSPKSSS
jgi:hypothetical protein